MSMHWIGKTRYDLLFKVHAHTSNEHEVTDNGHVTPQVMERKKKKFVRNSEFQNTPE